MVGALLLAASLVWDAPTVSTDGSPLTDFSHYCVKQSAVSGDYKASQCQRTTATKFPLPSPVPSAYYIVTAFDLAGNESGPSNEVSTAALAQCQTDLATMTADRDRWQGNWETIAFQRDQWRAQFIAADTKLRACEAR
jgi:hypothetical protein